MKVVYGYSNCSDKKYSELMSGKSVVILRPDQKYHGLLIKGLARYADEVICLSGLPINRELTSKVLISEKDEREGNIYYHYYTTLNFPIFRQAMIFLGALKSCFKIKKTEDTFAVCDCLNIANAYGMAIACRIRRIPIVVIVTDLPDMMSGGKLKKIINNKLFDLARGYIFLTQQMNDRINRKNKPYMVAEGHVDADLKSSCSSTKEESKKSIVMYAGGINEAYGIKNLTEGFLLAKIPDSELWIFGDGDFRESLEKIAKNNKSIKYMGVRDNDFVVEKEKVASLLVNPRPSDAEYTQYSFPSKNMEYMASGTPVMIAKLPGMPNEYLPYVYLIEEETAEGIADSLMKFFKEPLEMRMKKGKQAQEFVLEYKSNTVQAKRIIGFLKTL